MLFIRHFIFFLKASLPLKISLSQTSMKSSSPRRSVQPSLKATTPPAGDPLSLPGYPFQKYLLSSLAMEASTAGKLSPFVLSPMPLPNGRRSSQQKRTSPAYPPTGKGDHWNPCFSRTLIDWEMERVESYLLRLQGKLVKRDVKDKMEWMDEGKPSVMVWLFAVSYELIRGGSQHRIHGLFERALSNDRLRHSVLLWRCYIAYEIDIASNPSAARRVFFRAIHACPWSKKLWLDGFLKLKSVLSAKEMSDLQEVMRDKELNVRTDIYEILLQDDVGP
ncbi:Protein NRDE2-like [Vitis vinifera]|uniref:Protein NRDE2-like n=1 Tax=Vitis vinifera TaxID=29760 RepID=A0A438GQQ1_VITVI|nr:Protein NRDE2-like [Vitis vinifera]